VFHADVFVKFRDEQGNISSDDVNTLMMLYDAAHMRTRGEDILDSIMAFNKSSLQAVMKSTNLEPDLAEEVRVTLETTRFRRAGRVEARRFISVYEKKATRDDTVLEFAKLDYNIVQAVYCDELKQLSMYVIRRETSLVYIYNFGVVIYIFLFLSAQQFVMIYYSCYIYGSHRWWKDLRSQVDMTFSRDRLVEMYFWMTVIVYEPYYSYSRIMLTKLVLYMALMDDIYDNYSTTDESNIFTTALKR
jgi:hypothetical protein